MVGHAKRFVLILVGLLALALGAIGIFVPLLPTTPFVLVAAIAFANSSEKLHQWLLDHDVFGPLIENWRRYGAINRNTKVLSVLSMISIIAISLVMDVPSYVVIIQGLVLTISATFIVTRPLPPE